MAEQIYYSVFTKQGLALLTEAIQNGTKLGITSMAFGDGGGSLPEPQDSVTALVNEVHRTQLNSLAPDPNNANWLRAEAIIASAIGGFNIRELGLYAGDVLVAYSNYPATYKPNPSDGTARIMTFRMVLQIDNTANFDLVIDPDVVLATIQLLNSTKSEVIDFVKSRIPSIMDYGAIADGTYHALSEKYTTLESAKLAYPSVANRITSLNQSIDWAAAQEAINNNVTVLVDKKWFVLTDTLIVPDGRGFKADGLQYNLASGMVKKDRAALIFYGNGSKDYICTTLGDDVYQFNNPDAGSTYLDDSDERGNIYKLQNYNELFSAAVVLGNGSFLDGILVAPYHSKTNENALSGYYENTASAVAHKWDVGIWANNVKSWYLNFVDAKFQWRKAGLLISACYQDGLTLVANDEWAVYNSRFGGGTGVGIRSDNQIVAGLTNWGFANGSFYNCIFYGFDHNSNHLCTSSYLDNPLDRPSSCIELSGADTKPRGVDFYSCTIFGREDVSIYAGYASEIKFVGCYQESKSCKVNNAWIDALGSRMVVSSDASLQFIAHSKYGIDFSPNFTRESSVTRYTSSSGLFDINSISSDDDYESYRYINSSGVRLRRSNSQYAISNYDLSKPLLLVTSAGDVSASRNFNATGALVSGSYLSVGTNATVVGGITIGNGLWQSGNGTDVQFRRYDLSGAIKNYLFVSGTTGDISAYGNLTPSISNAFSIGSASKLWTQIYATNGTIQTSDENYKQDIEELSDAEKRVALACKHLIRKFRFKASCIEKGADARTHIGVIAQRVKEVFESENLDPFSYGILCHDSWEAKDAVTESWEDEHVTVPATFDQEGNQLTEETTILTKKAGSSVTQEAVAAGSRYAIRYDELAMFILAAI